MKLRSFENYTGRFFVLFLILFALLLTAPFVTADETGHNPVFVDILYAGIPLAAMLAVGRRRAFLVTALIIGVPTFIAALQGQVGQPVFPVPWRYVIGLVFYAFVCWMILRHIARTDEITADIVFCALSLYMLIGISFSNAYLIVEHVEPGSFYVSEAQNPTGYFGSGDLLYFSYVTLTTLGYGDVTPIRSTARSLAVVEAILGVMFMAVVIGRVVGIYSSKHKSRQYDP